MCAFWPFFTSLNKTYVSTTRERERVRGFVSVHFAVYIHKMHYAWIYAPFFFAFFSSPSCVCFFCFAMRLYIELHHLRILLRRIQAMLIFLLFLLAKSYKCLKLRQSVSCFTEWILANKKTNTFHRLLPISRHRLTRARSLLLTPGNKTLLNVPPRLQIYIV